MCIHHVYYVDDVMTRRHVLTIVAICSTASNIFVTSQSICIYLSILIAYRLLGY